MKPIELFKDKVDELNSLSYRGRSEIQKVIDTYENQDCIIAYVKTCLGTLFVIKGKQKFFSFVWSNDEVKPSYNVNRLCAEEIIKLFGIAEKLHPECIYIVDNEKWDKFKAEILLDTMEE